MSEKQRLGLNGDSRAISLRRPPIWSITLASFLVLMLFTTAARANTNRITIDWNTDADIDVHVYDQAGHHSYFGDQTAIPTGQNSVDIIPGAGDTSPHQEYYTDFGDNTPLGFCIQYFAEPSGTNTPTQVHYTISGADARAGNVVLALPKDLASIGASPLNSVHPYDPANCASGNVTPPIDSNHKQHQAVVLGLATGGAGLWCASGIGFSPFTFGLSAVLGCGAAALSLAATVITVNDPPDANFAQVFQPIAFPIAPHSKYLCRIRRLRHNHKACRRIKAAARKYLGAVGTAASVQEAVGVTANRFGTALALGDSSLQDLQRATMQSYLGVQDVTDPARSKAAHKLARIMRHYHINVVFSVKRQVRARKRLAQLKGIPNAMINRLLAGGLLSSRAELQQIIQAVLSKAPKPHKTTLRRFLAKQ